MNYAFFVNSDACSGCKTCQIACSDRHDLRAGHHWRRVYEVTAGTWQRQGGTWVPSVIAYHLSVACHHCRTPLCASSCSTEAILRREDGIVLIEQERCTKCLKCRADCPYDAIRYDAHENRVDKCDFCADDLARGKPPACVAACPNRALDFGDYDTLVRAHGGVDRVFPLPDGSGTRPSLVINPHRHAAAAQALGPEVANWEEL